MERKQSELTVITKAKDLCSYVMTVTQKSPKQFRFTFVSRLQNLALSAIENLFRANDVFVSKTDMPSQKERLSYQRSAIIMFSGSGMSNHAAFPFITSQRGAFFQRDIAQDRFSIPISICHQKSYFHRSGNHYAGVLTHLFFLESNLRFHQQFLLL